MSGLPRAADARIDLRKLRDYCLDPSHPRGRHKAKVFMAALGITRADSKWLANAILAALSNASAQQMETDRFGTRWRVDVVLQRGDRIATVRTLWLEPRDGRAPSLVTCYVGTHAQEESGHG